MGELLLRKVLVVSERLARLRAALPVNAEAVRDDERLEAFISFNLFLLDQDAVDLATHLVAARGLAVPGSQREVFEALLRHGLLSAPTATAMGALASLRNRIAHAYADLDPVRMVREAPAGLDQMERFIAEIAAALDDAR
jgi:uncharacterized protein YutE (UPF0331/DUF86 family)